MDNYPQINLRRVLKGVDFGTFYKVVKSRPEILDVLTAYEFNNEQTKQILNAFVDGLTLEQIKSCATSEYDSVQMLAIYDAYRSGLTVEQLSIVFNPDIYAVQMNYIIRGIQNGWEEKIIKLYSNPEFGIDQIFEIYGAILDGLSIMKIRMIAKTKFTAEQMRVLHSAFSSFESELVYKQVKVIANHKLSTEQMEKLVDAYNYGLTVEQVKEIAKEEYSPAQMQEIIEAYADEFTDEQMAFILNPKLDEYQMSQMRDAVLDGVSDEVLASISTGEYDYEHMEIIIEASKYGLETHVQLLLNPELDVKQADTIWNLCAEKILSIEEIKFLADPQNNWLKMQELSRWFMDNYSIEEVKAYSDKFRAEQLEKIRYGLKRNLDFMDLWVKPEFDECQMQEIISGIEKGFNKEQILTYLNSEIPASYMRVIRQDIEAGVPIEKVALYVNCVDIAKIEKARIKVLYEEICKLIK